MAREPAGGSRRPGSAGRGRHLVKPRRAWWVACTAVACACAGDAARSPTCGLALVAGPTLIQQRLGDARAVIVEPPRGLPSSLPARVAGQSDQGVVIIGYDGDRLVMGYTGDHFPRRAGYALLVVDDTSERAMGVLVYDREGPDPFPTLGAVHGAEEAEVPLHGVRVDWASVSNPRCPLLGTAPAP
jgi:hypothetical protein